MMGDNPQSRPPANGIIRIQRSFKRTISHKDNNPNQRQHANKTLHGAGLGRSNLRTDRPVMLSQPNIIATTSISSIEMELLEDTLIMSALHEILRHSLH